MNYGFVRMLQRGVPNVYELLAGPFVTANVPSLANSTGNCCHTQELIRQVSEKKLADEEFRTVTATLANWTLIGNKEHPVSASFIRINKNAWKIQYAVSQLS